MTTSQPPKDIILSTPTTPNPNISPVQEALGPIGTDTPLAPTPYEVQVLPTEDYEDDNSSDTSGTTGGSTIKFGAVTEHKYPLKNSKYLAGCNQGVIDFLVSLYNKYSIDLTDTEGKRMVNGVEVHVRGASGIKEVIRSVKGAWDFYQLLVDNQVQCVVQGFRRNTLPSPQGNSGTGLSGRQVMDIMGNVRNASRGGAQSRTEDSERWQAINTRGSVLARITTTGIGLSGYENNGVVIPTDLYNEVQLGISELGKEDWTLDDIKHEDHKKVIKLIHKNVNDFFTIRFPNPIHCMTSSYFTSKGNEDWLKHKDRKDINAGSYYMLCINTDTTAALDTTTRKTNLTAIGELPTGGNNAFKLTADSAIFNSFWNDMKDADGKPIKDADGNTTKAPGHELLMKANEGQYNRSITLPQGGFLFGDAGAPNPVTQNLVDTLTGIVNELEKQGTYTGSQLLGAITLKMMHKAGFPVDDYADMKMVNTIVEECKLENIISPFNTMTGDKYPQDVISVSKTVGTAAISLWAAWLVNMIVGVTGSNRAGAARGLKESQQASQSVEDVDDEEVDNFYASTLATTEAPVNPTSVNIPPSALPGETNS